MPSPTSPLLHPETTGAASAAQEHGTSIKETVTSVIIAFALAFVFRGFVIEAFLIPTGSMAPTLAGANMRFKSPASGYQWLDTPWNYFDPQTQQNPWPMQGTASAPIIVRDPMTGAELKEVGVPRSWGDRIFVMKYLYSIYDPSRYDVVVFKNPNDPTINYIKRLIGLPNEMVALIDGDVFSRTPAPGEAAVADPWALPGWTVDRKPERAQRTMWQLIFSSEYTPLKASRDGFRWFTSPWKGGSKEWQIQDRADYVYNGTTPTTLDWDVNERPIVDSYPYNELHRQDESPLYKPFNDTRSLGNYFPVSDLRLSMGVRPAAAGAKVSAVVVARGHEFRGEVDGTTVTLKMGALDLTGKANGPWTVLGTGTLSKPLTRGVVTNLDFWHADQALKMFVDDRLVAEGVYDWTPEERLIHSVGKTLAQVMSNPQSLADKQIYSRPSARFEFSGGGVTAYRVALSRDIHYEAVIYNGNSIGLPHSLSGSPAKGTHPTNTVILDKNQFFVCGDNSPRSFDARLWDKPNPWVEEIDPAMGVVNRDLLIGKAFFVYFPALYYNHKIPVPDFGSMRFIW